MRGLLAAMLLVAGGCAPDLDPGTWGGFRYFGELPSAPPMRLLPPFSDRDGNVYVLSGAPDFPDHAVYVGRPGGGWSGGCSAVRGLDGVRGFVGRTQSQAYYWAGDALVRVDGPTGACREVLSSDPVTGTEVRFLGVVPRVVDTPTQRWIPALIRGGGSSQPFFVAVDLETDRYFEPSTFELGDGDALSVVGTGADATQRRGLFLVTHDADGATKTEALFVSERGDTLVKRYDLPETLEGGSVVGFAQFADNDLGAALLSDGRVVALGTDEAVIHDPPSGFEPVGLERRRGRLYVVGLEGGDPAVVALSENGNLADPVPFQSALDARAALQGAIDVLDERNSPAARATWDDPVSALGPDVLLSPFPLDVYTTDTTGWLIAGPGFDSVVEPRTAVAFAPVGLVFP